MTVQPETPAQDDIDPALIPGAAETSADSAIDIVGLLSQVEDLKAQAAAAKEAQLRAIAELDNVRKRAEREIANAAKFSAEKLLGELLGICDSVDLGLAAAEKPEVAVKAIAEGLELTRKQLVSVLEKQGVTAVDPRGLPFNPDFHEAVSMVPSAEVAPNHVLSVMQKGYKLHERLLRPAMVIVARAPG